MPPVASTSSMTSTLDAGGDVVRVELEGRRAVFEFIGLGEHHAGKLARLADGQHAGPRDHGGRRGQQETPRFDTRDDVERAESDAEGSTDQPETFGVGKYRCQIPEQHTRDREVLLDPRQPINGLAGSGNALISVHACLSDEVPSRPAWVRCGPEGH